MGPSRPPRCGHPCSSGDNWRCPAAWANDAGCDCGCGSEDSTCITHYGLDWASDPANCDFSIPCGADGVDDGYEIING